MAKAQVRHYQTVSTHDSRNVIVSLDSVANEVQKLTNGIRPVSVSYNFQTGDLTATFEPLRIHLLRPSYDEDLA